MNPTFGLALSRVNWTVFASLTFRQEPTEKHAMLAAEKLLKWSAHIQRVPFRDSLHAIRIETGETNGRRHLHLLLVAERRFMGYFVVPVGMASTAYKWWKKHYGISRFRSVQAGTDSAVAYITKDMDAGADIYELAKTARHQHLIISPTAMRCIRRRIESADRQERAANTLAQLSPLVAKET
ncbi:MAG TPA: hypothetical protein VGI03_11705 [Verrucomicrobiae bacterium]|jgi:hypothetical protein